MRFFATVLLFASLASPVGAEPAAADDPEREGFFARQRLGIQSGYAWGFAAFGSRATPNEHVEFVPLVGNWALATPPLFRDTFMQGSAELQLEIMGMFQTQPTSGLGIGGDFMLRYNWQRLDPVLPFLEMGLGVGGIDFDVKQKDGFIFIVQGGAGTLIKLNDRFALSVEYRVHHLSNADTAKPNNGINTHMLLVGPTVFLY